MKQNKILFVLVSLRVFIYPTYVLFSWSVRPFPAFQGRRAITPNESLPLTGVPLKMFQSVLEC